MKIDAPVNPHFHTEKGYKFDIETPYEKRFPHVADRLGHPEVLLKPWEGLLRINKTLPHPSFIDQPFIQVPKAEPDEDLDFAKGEILYENENIMEWSKFWIYSMNIFSLSISWIEYYRIFLT